MENENVNQLVTLDPARIINGYLKQTDWRTKENSNASFSFPALVMHEAGAVGSAYWLNEVYPPEIAEAHRNAALHLHDLSMLCGYCAGWSLRQLIEEGFNGVADKTDSKPASHLSTLVNQMINFLGTMSNEWAGAQAFSSFDTYLSAFVKKDNLSDTELKQCLQNFVFGANTSSRFGGQPVFSNLTFDLVCPADLKDTPAIVGGKKQNFTYGDCQEEMTRLNKIYIDIILEGDASDKTFYYPIPTYNITSDFDWDSEISQKLFTLTGKYGTPYFQNFLNSDLNPSDVRSMCCRLRLSMRELTKRGGGLFGANEFTGSIGVVTLNLPRIGYLSKSEEELFQRLDQLLILAKDSLEIKRKFLNNWFDQGLYPYSKRYLVSKFNNHFSTIGLVGMNECCLNFLKKDISTKEGLKLAEKILDYMRTRLSDFQEETGNLYNLEATPAESTCYRLAKHDKERYPEIITSGTVAAPYYTNSTNLPVGYTEDVWKAIKHQESLQPKYTGGTVFHCFMNEGCEDWKKVRDFIKNLCSNSILPYFTYSPTFSVCKHGHGYIKGLTSICPKCAAEQKAEYLKQIEKVKAKIAEVEAE